MKIVIEFESNFYQHENSRMQGLLITNAILKNWQNLMQGDYKKHNYAFKIARLCYEQEWKPVLESDLSGSILTIKISHTTGIYARYVEYGQSD